MSTNAQIRWLNSLNAFVVAMMAAMLLGCTGKCAGDESGAAADEHAPVKSAFPVEEDEEWVAYPRDADGGFSIVYARVDVEPEQASERAPYLVEVRVDIASPDARGVAVSPEYDRLVNVDNSFYKVANRNGWVSVGRVFGNDQMRSFVYGEAQAKDVIREHLGEAYPDLEFEIDARRDPNWKTYRSVLQPSGAEWQIIGNQFVLEKFQGDGDDLSTIREVDHTAYFASRVARKAFIADLDGFDVDDTGREIDGGRTPFYVTFSHETSIEPHIINATTTRLFELAAEHNGRYDGWDAVVVRDNEPAP